MQQILWGLKHGGAAPLDEPTLFMHDSFIDSFITYMLGVHNYFETFSAGIMFSSDRDLSEHCGTDCASYEDGTSASREVHQVYT